MSTTIILLVLLALNAIFSCAEMAISSSRKMRLEQLQSNGVKNAAKVLLLLKRPELFISVLQIGLNIIAILAGVFGESALSALLLEQMQNTPLVQLGPKTLGFISTSVSVIAITWIFIVFAELIPKKIALAKKEECAMFLSPMVMLLLKVLQPFVNSLNSAANFVLSLAGADKLPPEVSSVADIYALVDQSKSDGVIVKNEQHLIKNVFQLDERSVSSAMTQRGDIIYLDIQDSEAVIKEKISAHPHSRFLLCDAGIDSPLGYIDASVILKKIIKAQSIVFNREDLNATELKKILMIPDTITLLDLLEKFKECREDIACVVSEYGLVVGVITLNDIMATLMGQAMPMPEQTTLIVARQNYPGSWLIDGKASIADVKSLFNWSALPNQESYETISGFLIMLLKSLPKVGEKVSFLDVEFEVVDVDGFRVDQLIATKIEAKKIET